MHDGGFLCIGVNGLKVLDRATRVRRRGRFGGARAATRGTEQARAALPPHSPWPPQTTMMTAAYDEIINFCLDADRVIVKVGDLLTKVMVQFVTNEVRGRSAAWEARARRRAAHAIPLPASAGVLPTQSFAIADLIQAYIQFQVDDRARQPQPPPQAEEDVAGD